MKYQPGDHVIVNPGPGTDRFTGTTWVVEKAPTRTNEVNYVLRPTGGGRGLKIRESYLSPAPDNGAKAEAVAVEPTLLPGTLVRFRASPGDMFNLYVVVAERDGRYRMFPLGGSERYFRNVSREALEVIPRERVKIEE